MTTSRSATHFARLYKANPDPWSFATSRYERAKYRATIAALGRRRFGSALEVGCSIGVLTRMLAPRCDRLFGIDIIAAPLAYARRRCTGFQGLHFRRMTVPAEWPAGQFDLVVLSEVLYFLAGSDIERCARRAVGSTRLGGHILLVNWLGISDDPTTGEQAAERFIAAAHCSVVRGEHHETWRLDLLRVRGKPAHLSGINLAFPNGRLR